MVTEMTTDTTQPGDVCSRERREALDAFWQVVKRLPAYGRLVFALARDGRIPGRSRAFLAVGGLYLMSPVDLIPGIIPVAGQIDDVYVALLALRQALKTLPEDVADEYVARYDLTTTTIDEDLASIRRLVRIGVADGARWSWARLNRLRRKGMQS